MAKERSLLQRQVRKSSKSFLQNESKTSVIIQFIIMFLSYLSFGGIQFILQLTEEDMQCYWLKILAIEFLNIFHYKDVKKNDILCKAFYWKC